MILAIETSSRQLGVAVSDGEKLLASYEVIGAEFPHAAELPPAVQRLLKETGTTIPQLDAVVVDVGPGSFTGLRIGLAFTKAFVFPSQRPVVGVPSLDILAAQVPHSPWPICPVLDAKQRNVYAARYRVEQGTPVRDGEFFLGPIADFLANVKGPTLFLGDGCALYRDQIVKHLGDNAHFAPPDQWLPRVATLARLGAARFASGQRDDPATLVPLYLYPMTCSIRSGSPQPATHATAR